MFLEQAFTVVFTFIYNQILLGILNLIVTPSFQQIWMKKTFNLLLSTEFAKVCERSTDFHFPNLEQQFLVIEEQVQKASEVRVAKKLSEDGDRISLKSTSSSSSDTQTQVSYGCSDRGTGAKASEVRVAKKLSEDGDRISLKSTSSSSSDTQTQVSYGRSDGRTGSESIRSAGSQEIIRGWRQNQPQEYQ